MWAWLPSTLRAQVEVAVTLSSSPIPLSSYYAGWAPMTASALSSYAAPVNHVLNTMHLCSVEQMQQLPNLELAVRIAAIT